MGFLVTGQMLYAVRVCVATPVPDQEGVWVVDPHQKGTWRFLDGPNSIKEWYLIPCRWCANTHQCAIYGFIAMEETGAHVPAVVNAFVQRRAGRKLLPEYRRMLCDVFDVEGNASNQAREVSLFEKVLDGHANVDDWKSRLRQVHEQMRQATLKRKGRDEKHNVGDSCEGSGSLSEPSSEDARRQLNEF